MAAKKIAIVIGSTRAVRIGDKVADFVRETLLTSPATPKPELSIIDAKDFNLPVFDEAVVPASVPAMAQFKFEHSKKWSEAMSVPDAYVLVSGEYNFGIPGGTKNAIDYLYNGFVGKPILIVTYGAEGGKTSSEALNKVFTGMKLKVVETKPQFTFAGKDGWAATAGQLGEESLAEWKKNTGDLLKGYEELIKLANAPPEPAKTA
ncbi:NADPH-dependent FMN reductase [Xylogone sp. PMI_703]|nr:NADPH-dependent FMN reductase [Xylogone sp. PMI_703]